MPNSRGPLFSPRSTATANALDKREHYKIMKSNIDMIFIISGDFEESRS